MKSTNLVFVLKNIDWIYIKSTDPVFFFFFFFFEKHRLDLYGKHWSVFCFEKYRSNLYENHRFGFFLFWKSNLYEKHVFHKHQQIAICRATVELRGWNNSSSSIDTSCRALMNLHFSAWILDRLAWIQHLIFKQSFLKY